MNRQQKSAIRSRGAAMVMAIVSLAVVAAILAAMMTLTADNVGRSQRETIATQLDQLHLAAIVLARQQLAGNEPQNGALPMPEPAISTLQWEAAGEKRTCIVTIELPGHRSQRRLTFVQKPERWALENVTQISG